jgi:Uma2 family endonuclease
MSPMTISLDPSSLAPSLSQRRDATWQDYVTVQDSPKIDWRKISFHQGWLLVDMGTEGPNHASFSDFITAVFSAWAFLHPEVPLQSYGRCLIENPETQACAPDLVLYRGEDIPRWQSGQPGRVVVPDQRVPDLVGEISDTTLSIDLDEQKQLYASLGIPEYWMIDVKGLRLFAFGLTTVGVYEPISVSQVLKGLPIALVEQALERLESATNTAAATWLMQQVQAHP